MTYLTQQDEARESLKEQNSRLNLALLYLALYVESSSRPDPSAFLQEQMRLWHQGSRMWLHTLLESERNYGFDEVGPEFQRDHLPSTPEQTGQKQAAPACILPNPLPETE
jgi:hypothetical protein